MAAMKTLALGLILLASPAFADVMLHDNKQKATVDCAKDKNVHIHGNDAQVKLTGTCELVMVAGNNAKISGSVKKVAVSGNSNTLDLDGVLAIDSTGNDNTITYKKSLDDKKPVGVSDTGNKNKISKK
jgi:hypothetical protein